MPATLKTKYEGIQRAMNKFNVIRVGDDTMYQHQTKILGFLAEKRPCLCFNKQQSSHIASKVTFGDHLYHTMSKTATHYMT